MVECSFKYTRDLLSKISNASTKNINLFSEIAMFIILVGAVVLFVTGNAVLGTIFSVIFVLLLASLVFSCRAVAKSNRILEGQQIKIEFGEDKMTMKALMSDKVLYNATLEYKAIKKIVDKQGLVHIYFDKSSAIVIPKSSFKTTDEYKKAMELAGNNYVV